MADNDPNDENQTDPDEGIVKMKREDIQALEASAKAGRESANIARELAMVKAGIDTDSPLGKMFFKSYEGDLTKEALTVSAQEIGLLEVTTKTPEVTQQERTSTQERHQLQTGSVSPDQNPKHPNQEAVEEAKRVQSEGGTYQDAAAAFIATKVKRFSEGDARAVKNPRDRFA